MITVKSRHVLGMAVVVWTLVACSKAEYVRSDGPMSPTRHPDPAMLAMGAIDWPIVCAKSSCSFIVVDTAIRKAGGPAFVPDGQPILRYLSSEDVASLSSQHRTFRAGGFMNPATGDDTAFVAIGDQGAVSDSTVRIVLAITSVRAPWGHWVIVEFARAENGWRIVRRRIVEG